jgi:exosortase E/protease (VPEID-CTERM system)
MPVAALPVGRVSRGTELRVGFLLGLAVLEIGILSVDQPLRHLWGDDRWWTRLAGTAHVLPELILTAGVAVALFGGRRLRRDVIDADPPHRWGGALAIHLLGLAGVLYFWGPAVRAAVPDGRVVALVAAALAAVGGWALAVLSARDWVRLAIRSWDVWAAAAGVVIIAMAASRGSAGLWGDLSAPTLTAVAAVLDVFTDEVVSDPAARVVGIPPFTVRVGAPCAGYEGLGLVAAFVGAFVWLRRTELRFPRALLLIPLGLAAVWLANVLRIAGLIGIGAAGWPEVAFGGFHSLAGWIAFNTVAVGVVVVGRSRLFRADTPEPTDTQLRNPAAAYLVPFAVFLGAGLITGAAAPNGFDRLYPVRVALGLAALWEFRRVYAGLGWRWSWLAVGTGTVVFGLWAAAAALVGIADRSSDIPAGLRGLSPYWATVWVVARVLGAVVVAPLAEELAFRGYLMRRIRTGDFEHLPPGSWTAASLGLSSVAFGLLHGEMWIAGTVAGMGYALVYGRRGRLADAVLAHAVTNALVATTALSGTWGLW